MTVNKQHGFTLIELMIVVGVIGILVSLAGPQYERYQRKARQSEAKIALGSIFSLEKSFYSEYSAYIGAFDSIGYSPEGARRFYLVAATDDGLQGGTVTGYTGAQSVVNISTLNSPYTLTNLFSATCGHWHSTDWANDSQSFLVYAQGNIGSGKDDFWTINDTKSLLNCSIGL